MKVNKNEEFASRQKRISHANKHVNDDKKDEFSTNEYKNSIRYEEGADKLASMKVNTSDINSSDNIIGFIETYKHGDDAYVKYNKQTKELVVYKPSSKARTGNIIYTFYKADDNKYNNLFDKYYKGEINA